MARPRSRPPTAAGAAESRAVTDALLSGLAAGRWRPWVWRAFLTRAGRRSREQALAHPRAVVELAALHAGYLLIGERRAAARVATSAALTLTHLGMLGPRASLGIANTITLTRANLPVLAAGQPRWLGAVALGSDILDGRLARHLDTESAFGAYADSLADAAFWIWFGAGTCRGATIRAASLLAWALPVAAVTALSIARGQMIDAPRPVLLRPAAAMQLTLALVALRRRRRSDP